MAIIKATDLANLLATNIDSTYQIIVFDSSGDTYQVEFEAATHQANTNIGTCSTLDESYDCGGDGVGREIIADAGAVKVSGTDGLLVTGTHGNGATSEFDNPDSNDLSVIFFNPRKAAFRAGVIGAQEWDDSSLGVSSVAMGTNTVASAQESFSMGTNTVASGDNSFSFGIGSTSSGDRSFSIGNIITSKSYSETAIGTYNTDYTPTSTSAWSATDRLFVVGNGQSSGTRADALIIQKNGNTTMPTTTGALTPPVLTTAERNALTPTAGMMIYNSTTNKHQGYDGTTWNDFY